MHTRKEPLLKGPWQPAEGVGLSPCIFCQMWDGSRNLFTWQRQCHATSRMQAPAPTEELECGLTSRFARRTLQRSLDLRWLLD